MERLFEDRHLLAVNKPPGAVVHEDEVHRRSLRTLLSEELAISRNRPSAYLQPVHRLDRGTSGALLFAKTSKALGRTHEWLQLSSRPQIIKKEREELYQGPEMEEKASPGKKSYYALMLAPPSAFEEPCPLHLACKRETRSAQRVFWEDWLVKEEFYARALSSKRLDLEGDKAKKSQLAITPSWLDHDQFFWQQLERRALVVEGEELWFTLDRCSKEALGRLLCSRALLAGQKKRLCLARIDLITGRYHQIRAQAAARGCWILGDWRYLPYARNALLKEQERERDSLASIYEETLEKLKELECKAQITTLPSSWPFYLHAKELSLPHPIVSPARSYDQVPLEEREKECVCDHRALISLEAPFPLKQMPLWSLADRS